MNEKTIIITENAGKYSLENNNISDFALIGILECLLLDLKSINRRAEIPIIEQVTVQEPVDSPTLKTLGAKITALEVSSDTKIEEINPIQKESTPDIRNRIKKATEAIRELGGQVENLDLSNMSDEELQVEFDELTHQYKRLKTSNANKKIK